MACTAITPARFKALKSQFSAVQDAVVSDYISLAQLWAADWPDSVCEAVQVAVTCHLMTLDGKGTDTDSKGFATGRGDMQSIRSGSVTLTRFRAASEGAGLSTVEWFSQTPCGRQFLVYLRMYKAGPRVAMGAACGTPSPYAKDWSEGAWWGF